MATKRKSKGAYMISAVAEMYDIHPQTLRLYEREGLLLPSRSEGNTRLYTDEDLERLEFILNLARDLGVNIAGIAIVLQMRERMEEMNRQMQGFVDYVRTEMLARMQQQQQPGAGLVPVSRPMIVPQRARRAGQLPLKSTIVAGKGARQGGQGQVGGRSCALAGGEECSRLESGLCWRWARRWRERWLKRCDEFVPADSVLRRACRHGDVDYLLRDGAGGCGAVSRGANGAKSRRRWIFCLR